LKKELLKKQTGITLVALIITIIILIILAAVSINGVLKMNFIDLAMQGTVNYTESQSEETKKFDELNDELNRVIEKISGKGKINDDIKFKVEKIISADGLKVTIRVEIEYKGLIENIYINEKRIDISASNTGVYIFEEVVEKNGVYAILAKDSEANYNVATIKVNEILGDMEIWDKEDMELLKKRVEEGRIFASTKITVMADIDLGGENVRWSPIGSEGLPFLGTLDGNNHKIKGIYIEGENKDTGLFSCNNGTIKNLILENGYVRSTYENTGILVGTNNGIVDNIKSTGEVIGESYTGGIVGGNYSGAKITNCINNANVNKDKTSFSSGLNCGRYLRM